MKQTITVLISILTIGLFLLSFGALIETNIWWIRMTDFPRLQYLIALAILLVIIGVFHLMNRKLRLGLAGIALIAMGFNTVKLFPYFVPDQRARVTCDADQRFSVLVANVQMGNRNADALVGIVESRKPDLFLALETDEWWDARLALLSEEMPFRAQGITGGYFGIHLFSRLALRETEVIFPVEQDAPAIFTHVELPSGSVFRFIGLHPRPPHPGQSSLGRDAQLMSVALRAREGGIPALIAGDLNAVPWETTIERLQRVGGFIDPREGNGYHATYDAQSWWMSWPLDQVLHQKGLSVMEMAVLADFGSDHYPIEVTLCDRPSGLEPPELRASDIAQAKQEVDLALQGKDERR